MTIILCHCLTNLTSLRKRRETEHTTIKLGTKKDGEQEDSMLLDLNVKEVMCVIAALNYTRNRTLGISWEPKDEKLLMKLKDWLDKQ